MNRERLQIVRDRIASEPPERLNMRDWKCGTAFCIGGWSDVIQAESLGFSQDDIFQVPYKTRDVA